MLEKACKHDNMSKLLKFVKMQKMPFLLLQKFTKTGTLYHKSILDVFKMLIKIKALQAPHDTPPPPPATVLIFVVAHVLA